MGIGRVYDCFCPKVARDICYCGAVYHSELDTQLGAYESTIQQGVHSTLASLKHSLEDFGLEDVPANSQ